MTVQIIAQQRNANLVLRTGRVCGFVLQEQGPNVIPPLKTYHSSLFPVSEADLHAKSALMIAVSKAGGDVETFQKQLKAWLEAQTAAQAKTRAGKKQQKEVKSQASALAKKHVRPD